MRSCEAVDTKAKVTLGNATGGKKICSAAQALYQMEMVKRAVIIQKRQKI